MKFSEWNDTGVKVVVIQYLSQSKVRQEGERSSRSLVGVV